MSDKLFKSMMNDTLKGEVNIPPEPVKKKLRKQASLPTPPVPKPPSKEGEEYDLVEVKLTGKQDRFCREYMTDYNATQAAIRAGYSEHTAYSIGHENLRKPEIKAFLMVLRGRINRKLDVTTTRIVQEIASIAFANQSDVIERDGEMIRFKQAHEVPEYANAAIKKIRCKRRYEGKGEDAVEVEDIEIEMHDKKGALDMLMKHAGGYILDDDDSDNEVRIQVTYVKK